MDNYHRRQRLIDLSRLLPESEIQTALRFLEFLTGKVSSEAQEPPLTADEMAESEENWQAIMSGEGIPWEEVRKGLADE